MVEVRAIHTSSMKMCSPRRKQQYNQSYYNVTVHHHSKYDQVSLTGIFFNSIHKQLLRRLSYT